MLIAPNAASCLMILQADCRRQNACSNGCSAQGLHTRALTCILSPMVCCCRAPSVHPALLHSLGRLPRSGQRLWAVTGTSTGRFSTWPSVVAILMKPSRYNAHKKDTNRSLPHFILHCLVFTAWFRSMTTKTGTKPTVEGTSQTAVGTSQIAVGTSQSVIPI